VEKIMSVTCRIIAFKKDELGSKNKLNSQQTGAMAVIEILTDFGDDKQLVISRSQDFNLELGDKIRCVSGQAVVMINQGIQAGSRIISETSPNPHLTKYPSLLEITAEITNNLPSGKIHIHALNDLGNVIRSAAATTRKLTENVAR
jgi:hypothetical protein